MWDIKRRHYSTSNSKAVAQGLRQLMIFLIAYKISLDYVIWFDVNNIERKSGHGQSADVDVDLSPQVNTALRSEILYYTTSGIKESVREVTGELVSIPISGEVEAGKSIKFWSFCPTSFRSWVDRNAKVPSPGDKSACRYCNASYTFGSTKNQECGDGMNFNEPDIVLKDNDLMTKIRIDPPTAHRIYDQIHKDSDFCAQRMERLYKTFIKRKDPEGVSALPPKPYKFRFQQKMSRIFALSTQARAENALEFKHNYPALIMC
ncbi:hypothetical protein PsorP6_002986 [Peronosclerospora sorghi]|uniref:Uncharacterized protein n=1 Tax=Peronosclerospora sorghi TaxID=230839 RepID=A0ACC0VQ87_9STRA|nr:hypothetical protein PsorP6_002986 [Peronosclerospora sorghi]